MTARWMALVACSLLATACNPNGDDDLDGLINKDERALGTDAKVADSDGDGYPDGFEVEMGSDPLDSSSLAYSGGWPFNADKDAFDEGSRSGNAWSPNKTWPRSTMSDQFGDDVDVYDFAQQGVPVVIDLSAEWCPPCRNMAYWLEVCAPSHIDGDDDPAAAQQLCDQSNPFGGSYTNVPRAVEEGEILWITIIPEADDGSDAKKKTVKRWYNDFPSPHIPVLADGTRYNQEYAGLTAWPTLFFLNEKLKVKSNGQSQVLGDVEALMTE